MFRASSISKVFRGYLVFYNRVAAVKYVGTDVIFKHWFDASKKRRH